MLPAAFERTNATDPTTAASPAMPRPINPANGAGHHLLQTRRAGTSSSVTAEAQAFSRKEVSVRRHRLTLVTTTTTTTTQLDITGPFDLREVAMMGFGHRDERNFDSVMRMAFCLDGDYERQVGVEATQIGDRLDVQVIAAGDPLNDPEMEAQASCPSDLT